MGMLSSDTRQDSQPFLPVFEWIDFVTNDDDVFTSKFFFPRR